MNSKEIIKACLNNNNKLPKTFSRYIHILNNYINNKSLSVIEKKNNPNNEAKESVLIYLASNLKIELNTKSSLFEGRLKTKSDRHEYEEIISIKDGWFFKRFFNRIELLRKHNIDLLFKDLIMGSLYFTDKYGEFFFEDDFPLAYSLNKNTYRYYSYREEVHLNIIDYLYKLDNVPYRSRESYKVAIFISYTKHESQEVKNKALLYLNKLKENGSKDILLDSFFKKYNFISNLKK